MIASGGRMGMEGLRMSPPSADSPGCNLGKWVHRSLPMSERERGALARFEEEESNP
jgi:hypothetical protein